LIVAEREFETTPYGVDYICDRCHTGLMEAHGKTAWLTDPIQHPHRCTNCGHEQAFTERYPTVRWRRGEVIARGVKGTS
jgi:DNA-directed RNA polymerase subunit RPC12/RpoP